MFFLSPNQFSAICRAEPGDQHFFLDMRLAAAFSLGLAGFGRL
jgi:hypothetical protein